nr:retrotransposon protein, putative, Ty1-copia subclass [Tanacetum cinerariifolium]
MGKSTTTDIKGEGDVILKMTFVKELKLTNVLYVLKVHKNLVSSWLLIKFGFRLVFKSDKFVLSKNQMYVGRGYAVKGMFKLNVMVVKNDINKVNSSAYLIESSNVWHGRLRHETGSSSRLDEEVIQDKRQRDFNDLHDERQDQLEEEEVAPRRSKRARTEKSFGPDFVSFMELVNLPPGCKPPDYKCIFKKKMKADGTIEKYKARLLIQGFRQRKVLDYFDTYSPVTRITPIRMIPAIVALRNLEVHQMDVKTTFLNGYLEEEIYMNQPERTENKNGFEKLRTYDNKKDAFLENYYVQPGVHDTFYQGQKGGHHGSDIRMQKLKMPLIDGEDSHGWIYKVESSQSGSRLAVPIGGQTSSTKEHYRRMTESELEERRAKGLCFRCEEKFKPDHRCASHTLQVMIFDDSDEENEPYLHVKPWDHALKAD